MEISYLLETPTRLISFMALLSLAQSIIVGITYRVIAIAFSLKKTNNTIRYISIELLKNFVITFLPYLLLAIAVFWGGVYMAVLGVIPSIYLSGSILGFLDKYQP